MEASAAMIASTCKQGNDTTLVLAFKPNQNSSAPLPRLNANSKTHFSPLTCALYSRRSWTGSRGNKLDCPTNNHQDLQGQRSAIELARPIGALATSAASSHANSDGQTPQARKPAPSGRKLPGKSPPKSPKRAPLHDGRGCERGRPNHKTIGAN